MKLQKLIGKLSAMALAVVAVCSAVAASAVMSLSANAETDIYGNEIRTYSEGGATKTYKFWVSGTKAEVATFDNTSIISSSSGSLCSGMLSTPSAETVPLEARFRTWFSSLGAALRSDKWFGTILIVW